MAVPVAVGRSMPVPAAMAPIAMMIARAAGDALAHYVTRWCVPWRVISSIAYFMPTAAITFAVIVPHGDLERNACVCVRYTDREHHSRKYNELLHICLSLTRDCFFIAVRVDELCFRKFNPWSTEAKLKLRLNLNKLCN